nr:hypothetical protein [Tanacetum cinerariifolium]
VHELEVFSFELQDKVTVNKDYVGQLEKFQDDRMKEVNDKFERLYDDFIEMALHLEEKFYYRDYIFALQQLQNVNFSLLAELKSNTDSSVETLMNILRLEEALTERLGLNELQPHVDQLMVPIHHSPDKTVVGAIDLSLFLDVSSVCVQKIRENIVSTKGTSNAVTTAATTTALSSILVSISTVNPIYIDDYEVMEADDQSVAGGNAAPFPNVDDADLHIP